MKWIICLVLCISFSITGFAETESNKVLTIGTWKTQQTIQPFLYSKFLPKQYICEVKPFTNPGDMKIALLAGSLDICGTTIVTAILSSSRGEPVVLVCKMADKCSALVVRSDSDIKTTGDLRGKKIGYVPSTLHHILLLEALRNSGLTDKDVQLIRVDFFDMVQALFHKQIDAFQSGEPYPTLAVKDRIGKILEYPYFEKTIGAINAGMLVRRDYIEKYPEIVQDIVSAHVRATKYLSSNHSEWIKRAVEFGNPVDVVEQASKNIELSWDMDDKFISQAKMLGEKMKELGIIDKLPDWDKLIDTRFVQKARSGK
jgi:NitT/TauT family transport system substrate-binding protein